MRQLKTRITTVTEGQQFLGRVINNNGRLSGFVVSNDDRPGKEGNPSISGILETTDGPRYVSMIANGSYAPNSVMGQILLASQRISRCPAWTAAVTLPAEPD